MTSSIVSRGSWTEACLTEWVDGKSKLSIVVYLIDFAFCDSVIVFLMADFSKVATASVSICMLGGCSSFAITLLMGSSASIWFR